MRCGVHMWSVARVSLVLSTSHRSRVLWPSWGRWAAASLTHHAWLPDLCLGALSAAAGSSSEEGSLFPVNGPRSQRVFR